VEESLSNPDPTYGLKLRGNLNNQISRPRWRLYGDLLGQTFLDGKFRDERKLVANMEFGFRYALSSRVNLMGRLSHFQKTFYSQSRSYRWTEYGTYLQFSPLHKITTWINYIRKSTAFRSGNTIRFYEDNFEIRGRYTFNPRLSLEGIASSGSIAYKDYEAWDVESDTSLIMLGFDQNDKFLRGLFHFRYQGKLILGIQTGFESVTSNSVIGEFEQMIYRIYLSGRWGSSNFYHLVLQRVNKDYR